jgi:2-keto-3-deoxy-L-rhamnonate aldolase RhmA
VEVVVVVEEHLNDASGTVKVGAGADEDDLWTRLREPVDEVLGEAVVDLVDRSRRSFAPVAARVVDIGVESVLVRDVAGAAEARAEVAAMRA